MKGYYRLLPILLAFLFMLLAEQVQAHPVINYAMKDLPTHEVAWFYIKMGILHIIPLGVDHILFVVSLCLLSKKLKTILWQATAFTVAHSITLALSIKSVIVAPGEVVEPIIALSIVFVAIENILLNELKFWRIAIVFFFGLIHGLGFASALNEVGIPPGQFVTSILSFNVGVELGQVIVILLVFVPDHSSFRTHTALPQVYCYSYFNFYCPGGCILDYRKNYCHVKRLS